MSTAAPAPFVVRQSKVCSKCGETKPLSDYYLRDGRPRPSCKPCWNRSSQDYQKANPERYREYSRRSHAKVTRRQRSLMNKYGMTIEEFDAIWLAQGECCAICRGSSGDNVTHVDHDHNTNQFRGILCGLCNRMLGQGGDDPERLEAGAAYLRRTS